MVVGGICEAEENFPSRSRERVAEGRVRDRARGASFAPRMRFLLPALFETAPFQKSKILMPDGEKMCRQALRSLTRASRGLSPRGEAGSWPAIVSRTPLMFPETSLFQKRRTL